MRQGWFRAAGGALAALGLWASVARPAEPEKNPAPAKVAAAVVVIAAEPVRNVWPALGDAVAAPPTRSVLVPGQPIALGVLASGDAPAAPLAGVRLGFRIRDGERVVEVPPAPPVAVKLLRAQGANFALGALRATGVDVKVTGAEVLTLRTALAVVVPEWTPAPAPKARQVIVEGTALWPDGRRLALAPATITIETWAGAAAKAPFEDDAGMQAWCERYALAPEPQHLAAAIRRAAQQKGHPLSLLGFPASALEAFPAAIPPVVEAVRADDERTRLAAAVAIRWAGGDPAPLLATLGASATAAFADFHPPPSPVVLDLDASALAETSARMDLLWGRFMATGRPEPLRQLVDLLALRDDYPALQAAKAKTEPRPPVDRIVRGVLYVTAGWSISSFAVGEGPASDHLARWREDPKTPAVIREELRRIPGNPAFRPQ
jgi:hypothetical protein